MKCLWGLLRRIHHLKQIQLLYHFIHQLSHQHETFLTLYPTCHRDHLHPGLCIGYQHLVTGNSISAQQERAFLSVHVITAARSLHSRSQQTYSKGTLNLHQTNSWSIWQRTRQHTLLLSALLYIVFSVSATPEAHIQRTILLYYSISGHQSQWNNTSISWIYPMKRSAFVVWYCSTKLRAWPQYFY